MWGRGLWEGGGQVGQEGAGRKVGGREVCCEGRGKVGGALLGQRVTRWSGWATEQKVKRLIASTTVVDGPTREQERDNRCSFAHALLRSASLLRSF